MFRLQVSRPHVLAGIHPESLDADVDEIVEVSGNLVPDIVLAAVEVVERDEVAVPDVVGVIVVVDVAVRLVEVLGTERNTGVILAPAIEALKISL